MIHAIEFTFVAVVSGYIGYRFNSGTIAAIEAELSKVETSTVTEVKALVAAIKSHL
jgi:hypothetical protein